MNQYEKALLEELLELVRALEDTGTDLNINERFTRIRSKYQDIKDMESFWGILDGMCQDIPDTYFMLLEYLFGAVRDEVVLRKEFQVLADGIERGAIDLFSAIFYKWQMIYRNFMMYNSKFLFIERSKLHLQMLQKMKEYLGYDLDPIPKEERDHDKVVVTITQLLGIKHGPTRNALDYCYVLQKKLGKKVFLFVASEMPGLDSPEFDTLALEYQGFNYEKRYEGEFTLEYRGELIRGYQCRVDRNNRDDMIKIILGIYNWKPYLIYNIGSENLLVDLCGSFTQEVTVPCANEYPVAEADYHIVTRRKEERDKEILDYLRERNQKVIESIFVYKLEEPLKSYAKSNFGLPEDAYVISVVGTRLAQEVDEPFIEVLKKLLELDACIHIVFMGGFDGYEEKLPQIGDPSRVRYLGHQNDLRGAYHAVDLYLNPPRKGGGTSAAEALSEGVPVITMKKCDVAYTSGDAFLIDSMEEVSDLVHRYMTDMEFRDRQKEKAYQQAARVVDTEAVLREILEKIDLDSE